MPPRRPNAPKPTKCGESSLYDKVPPPRRISEPARPKASSACLYDTPPTPRRVKEFKKLSVIPDVSPKTPADYNSKLRYVDLSAFDGCPDSQSQNNGEIIAAPKGTRKWSRSKSMDQTSTATNLTEPQNSAYKNVPQSSPIPSPRLSLRPRSTDGCCSQTSKMEKTDVVRRMRKLANSSDNVRPFSHQPVSVNII